MPKKNTPNATDPKQPSPSKNTFFSKLAFMTRHPNSRNSATTNPFKPRTDTSEQSHRKNSKNSLKGIHGKSFIDFNDDSTFGSKSKRFTTDVSIDNFTLFASCASYKKEEMSNGLGRKEKGVYNYKIDSDKKKRKREGNGNIYKVIGGKNPKKPWYFQNKEKNNETNKTAKVEEKQVDDNFNLYNNFKLNKNNKKEKESSNFEKGKRKISGRGELEEKMKKYYSGPDSINQEADVISTESVEMSKSRNDFNKVLFISHSTDKGAFKKINEDRISIVLNLKKDDLKDCHYVGVFDGHCGKSCSDFLKHNTYKQLLAQKDLLNHFTKNMTKIFRKMDDLFLEKAIRENDRSGSCAIVLFIYEGRALVANTGDSRAIASAGENNPPVILSIDQKPNNINEQKRIIQNGGYIYNRKITIREENRKKNVYGPLRIFPGGLTTSRSFGDFDAKVSVFGGKKNVIICDPEFSSKNTKNLDFIVIGSDGLFESVSNEECIKFVYAMLRDVGKSKVWKFDKTAGEFLARRLVQFAIERGSSDNVSVVLIFFESILKIFEERKDEV